MSCPPPSEARRRSAEASGVDRVGCVGLLKILKEELWWSEGYWSLEVAWILVNGVGMQFLLMGKETGVESWE
nr:hypothetical protein Iba_chr02bCG12710 [Ipomoea batatas]